METFTTYIKLHKILILHGGEGLEEYPNIVLDEIYAPLHTAVDKTLFKLYEHVSPSLLDRSRWYGDWKHHIGEYDTVIIVNGIRGRDVVEYIQKKNPDIRVILYYETTIDPSDRKAPQYYRGLDMEFVSFDQKDCLTYKDYNMRFAPFYYTYRNGTESGAFVEEESLTSDLFFVGYDKNRLDALSALKEKCIQIGLKPKFYIVKTPHKVYSSKHKGNLTEQKLSYEKIRQHIRHTRAVLDFMEEGQTGITLRPMEAIFYRKKLITNNSHVRNYDFYRPENVFFIHEQPIDALKDFLREPYKNIPQEIIEQYTPEAWMCRVLGL